MITTVNPNYDPNKIFKTHTWVRFAYGRTLVGVNESDTAFATTEKTGGEKTHKLTASEMPGHEHDVRQEGNTGRLYIGTGHSSGNYYSMILSGNSAWADDISWGGRVKTHSAGNSEPHNNMPPYTTVYFWKRTK